MHISRLLRGAVIVTASMAPALAAAQAPAAVDRAVAAWSKIHSLSGTFDQTITNPLTRTTSAAQGQFRQQQPNKLAVRFTNPAGDAIVSDGQYLWVFLQQAAPGQVIRKPMTDQLAMPLDIGQFLESPAAKYDITAKGAESVGGRPAQMFALVPKKGTSAVFTRATVWIDDADSMIRQFEVVESSGLTRRIRLTSVTMNPTVPASEFRFVVPKGVKVVDR